MYMSPEQAEMGLIDVDTRCDVYALGVLLYELLVGDPPLSRETFKSASFDEVRRIIREVEPKRPSFALSTLAAERQTTLADQRHIEFRKLRDSLHGELDWIVMRALEKDRNRRYESASAMAADVERYLNDEPVAACPPSTVYRLRKFARRNKTLFGTAAAVAAVLLMAAGGSLWQAVEATAARDLAKAAATAEATARQQAEANEREAQARQDEIAAVLNFVEERIFSTARPEGQEGGLGRDVRLRDAITTALSYLEAAFPEQPLIEARLRNTLGKSFRYLGEAGAARQQHERAGDLYRSQLGPDHPDTLDSMVLLANSYRQLGRYEDALSLQEKTLELQKAKLVPPSVPTCVRQL